MTSARESPDDPPVQTMRSVGRIAIGLVALIVSLVVSSSLAADTGSVRRVGYITTDPRSEYAPYAAAFSKGLADGGYIEGKTVIVERRFGTPGATRGLFTDLLALKVALLNFKWVDLRAG